MATIIRTEEWKPSGDHFEQYQVYNGLDCCLTHEILEEVKAQHPEWNSLHYRFARGMQAPALEMMLRGFRVDLVARDAAIEHLQKQLARVELILNAYGFAAWDREINPRSPKQLIALFYSWMGLPPVMRRNKQSGEWKPSVDRDALEKLQEYFHARPIVKAVLKAREISKLIGILRTEVDRDQRMRTSYNIAGTDTGRWSSSENAYGTGTNLQNIPERLRRIFIADPGMKLFNCDLEQAESRLVGILCYKLFGMTNYIDACESGDLHTLVAKLVWQDLPWTGDPKQDRAIAERRFYRDLSYRDMSKRGGHGTNYLGKDYTMAKHLKVPVKLITNFQRNYFEAFPEIPMWQRWVAEELQTTRELTSLTGRRRIFFDRAHDDATLRKAIAYDPQGSVGDILNTALWRVWDAQLVELLAQVHDSIAGQFPDDAETEARLIPAILERMAIPLTVSNPAGIPRTFIIPAEAATGWNWGKFNDDPTRGPINLAGVRKWKPGAPETRKRPADSGLDRVIPVFH